jgi:hypothetical protein
MVEFDHIPEVPAQADYGKWSFFSGLRVFAEKTIDIFKTTDFDSTTQNDWKQPGLLNDWQSWDVTSNALLGPARYRKDINGTVHLAGLVKDGSPYKTIAKVSNVSAAEIFILPPGYRPEYRLVFPVDVGWKDTAWTEP